MRQTQLVFNPRYDGAPIRTHYVNIGFQFVIRSAIFRPRGDNRSEIFGENCPHRQYNFLDDDVYGYSFASSPCDMPDPTQPWFPDGSELVHTFLVSNTYTLNFTYTATPTSDPVTFSRIFVVE